MGYEFICPEGTIKPGEKKSFDIAGQKVLLIQTEEKLYATQAKCPHMGAPLEKGHLIDANTLQCKFHRAEFNIETGKVIQWACFPPGIQALNFFRSEKDLITYETKTEDGKVLILL